MPGGRVSRPGELHPASRITEGVAGKKSARTREGSAAAGTERATDDDRHHAGPEILAERASGGPAAADDGQRESTFFICGQAVKTHLAHLCTSCVDLSRASTSRSSLGGQSSPRHKEAEHQSHPLIHQRPLRAQRLKGPARVRVRQADKQISRPLSL